MPRELKPENVMRALECHSGNGDCFKVCPYFTSVYDESCLKNLVRDALALLREKDALIEALSKNNADLEAELAQTHDAVEEKDEEIDRLRAEYSKLTLKYSKAITEFEERLIKYYDALKSGLVAYHIKEVAKELKEDLNAT